MSTPLMDEITFTVKYMPGHSRDRVLKSRENISKLKCNKSLKKKLKKYKLRKDGREDPDIIDVSQNLIKSLRIKSPNNQQIYSHKVNEENRPHNYLSKMVRLKKSVTVTESTSTIVQTCNIESKNETITLIPKDDQNKKQTDAFKLLMDSRNKSIGSNSPGKEKCDDDSDVQERAANKELRAKRILSLNKMAQAKGSLKKLEIEEYREENVKRKMEDRAKRLKHMIVDVGVKNGKRNKISSRPEKMFGRKVEEKEGTSPADNIIENKGNLHIKKPVFKSFDLFDDMKVSQNSNGKRISKEDEEFLKKLSPSIRKKENMLSYFRKVCKDPDTLQGADESGSQNIDQDIIKVKLKPRTKVTKKKNKPISENGTNSTKSAEGDAGTINDERMCNTPLSSDNIKKRKRNENKDTGQKDINNCMNGTVHYHSDSRPKRNSKKPMKYSDDFQLTSSDEELHIFTPKKKVKNKRGCVSTLKPLVNYTIDLIEEQNCKLDEKVISSKEKNKDIKKKLSGDQIKSSKIKDSKNMISKKAPKLAPIFMPKPLPDSAAMEAKQKFLQSGVPSQLKKSLPYQSNMLASTEFQKVVHIHLNKTLPSNIDTPIVNDIFNTNYFDNINLREEKNLFKKLLQVPVLDNYSQPKFQQNIDQVLKDIKKNYPKFPVYRTYHLLKGKSKGEFKDCIYPDLDNSFEIFNNMVDINNLNPDQLNWADKYKPSTEKQVIGNFDSIRELKQWLVTWTENDAKSKKNKDSSDSSDFYPSDTERREAMKNENNLLIITGKVGTGKTLSVYAVAAELAIKVIEVNASTKRTGKIMLQDLQEATQSHKVDRGKNSTDSPSQKSQELHTKKKVLKVYKKRGRKPNLKDVTNNPVNKTENAEKERTELIMRQENVRTGMSLILIDDADIVFDQDDGFCYAISQLIQSSKRPVILVTSSLTCPHLQKFSSLAKVIKMRPFLPRMLGTWLDIMCLVDNNMCSLGMGAKVLDLFKGDIRRTIHFLQFYNTSHKHKSIRDNPGSGQGEEVEVSTVIADDENSCMSWGDNEGWGEKNIAPTNSNYFCNYFVNKESQFLHFMSPLNKFDIWWNLPNLLSYSKKYNDEKFENFDKTDKMKETKELDKIASVLDNMSMTDYLGSLDDEPNITSKPWQSFEKDSVIDNENFTIYNRNNDNINEISWELMTKSITKAQRDINPDNRTEINYPSMSLQRERDRVVSRHKTLAKCLNPSTVLDRRALALDYWSACRSICRTEKSKTNTNIKRNNRFCHYLKSLNIVCRNEYFDSLGESLSFT